MKGDIAMPCQLEKVFLEEGAVSAKSLWWSPRARTHSSEEGWKPSVSGGCFWLFLSCLGANLEVSM
ncbi:mCG148244 [Mus musculus]|nr:mCG148244 [Mus musculus]